MKKSLLTKILASGFYSGYSPIVPGTTGTIPAWLIAFFIVRGHPIGTPALAVALLLISVFLAGRAEAGFGHDAKKIVIDEWAGMFVALVFIPYSLTHYIIAFVAFRALDAVKIFPANAAEKLHGGWGVTADDFVAGIQANLLTQLIIFAFKL